jgi:hypothetical protein
VNPVTVCVWIGAAAIAGFVLLAVWAIGYGIVRAIRASWRRASNVIARTQQETAQQAIRDYGLRGWDEHADSAVRAGNPEDPEAWLRGLWMPPGTGTQR